MKPPIRQSISAILVMALAADALPAETMAFFHRSPTSSGTAIARDEPAIFARQSLAELLLCARRQISPAAYVSQKLPTDVRLRGQERAEELRRTVSFDRLVIGGSLAAAFFAGAGWALLHVDWHSVFPMGWRTGAYAMAILPRKRRQKTVSHLPSASVRHGQAFKAGSGGHVEFDIPGAKEGENFFDITIRTRPDQPGLLEAITRVIAKRGRNILPGSGSPADKNPDGWVESHFVVEKDDVLDHNRNSSLYALVKSIWRLRVPVRQVPAGRRMAMHLWLSDTQGAFSRLWANLTRLGINVESFQHDPLADEPANWLEAVVDVPKKVPDSRLRSMLARATIRTRDAENTRRIPLLPKIELFDKEISEATARELLRILESELEIPHVPPDPSDLAGAQEPDRAFIAAFLSSLAISYDFHGYPQTDDPKNGKLIVPQTRTTTKEPFVRHTLAVTYDVIKFHGVRDPSVLLAAPLHDVLEDAPGNVWLAIAGLLQSVGGDPKASALAANRISLYQKEMPNVGGYLAETIAAIRALPPDDSRARTRELWHLITNSENRFRDLARQDIEERIRRDLPSYPEKVIRNIKILSHLEGDFSASMKILREKGGPELAALKLADRGNNLLDIFHPDYKGNPARRIFRTLDTILPLVMLDAPPDDGYRNGRRHFLKILIMQTVRVDHWNDVMMWAIRSGADLSQFAGTISAFLRWMRENPDCLPPDVSAWEMQEFELRLREILDFFPPPAAAEPGAVPTAAKEKRTAKGGPRKLKGLRTSG